MPTTAEVILRHLDWPLTDSEALAPLLARRANDLSDLEKSGEEQSPNDPEEEESRTVQVNKYEEAKQKMWARVAKEGPKTEPPWSEPDLIGQVAKDFGLTRKQAEQEIEDWGG